MPPKRPSVGGKTESNDENINRLEGEKMKLEEKVKMFNKDFDLLTQVNKELMEKKDEKIRKLEEEKRKLEDKVKLLHKDFDLLTQENKKLLESVGLKADMQKKEHEIVRLQNELTEAKGELKKTENERKKISNDFGTAISTIEELRIKISKLEKEKAKIDSSNSRSKSDNVYRQKLEAANNEIEELKTRLSKVMGANITDINPDIADLSDLNRPTKLAEKYSELYDNEWTDAIEEIENDGVPEKDAIKRLLDSLKDVYTFCNQVSVNYTRSITASALLVPGAATGGSKTANLPDTFRNQITELRRSFAPSLAGDVFKLYLKTTKQSLDKCPQTKRYIKACVDLCWLMSIEDPPVVLDLEEPRGPFDGVKYRTFTRAGKTVDYVVWPPMRLHDGGALLLKGVAQGK